MTKKHEEGIAMQGNRKNTSQLEELRDPEEFFLKKYCRRGNFRFFDAYPFAPLGHIRSILLELSIVKIEEWSQFLNYIKDELKVGGNSFAFSSNLEKSIPSRMLDNMWPALRKHYHRRINCGKYRRLIEECYGHPYMTDHYFAFCQYCVGFKLRKLKLS